MSEEIEDVGEAFTEDEKEVLIQKGLVLTQLLESPKFVQFLNMNYDFIRHEGEKMMYVVEVPDEVAMERAAKIMKEQVKQAPSVVTATPEDLKRLEKKQR